MFTYRVEGTGCGSCADAIERAIAGVAPAAVVRTDVKSGRIYLSGAFDPLSVEAVVTAAGYAAIQPCREAGGRC